MMPRRLVQARLVLFSPLPAHAVEYLGRVAGHGGIFPVPGDGFECTMPRFLTRQCPRSRPIACMRFYSLTAHAVVWLGQGWMRRYLAVPGCRLSVRCRGAMYGSTPSTLQLKAYERDDSLSTHAVVYLSSIVPALSKLGTGIRVSVQFIFVVTWAV